MKSTDVDLPAYERSPSGRIVLPHTVLYEATRYAVSSPRGRALYSGLGKIGPVPLVGPDGKIIKGRSKLSGNEQTLGGMDWYDECVTTNPAYRYPEFDRRIYADNADEFSLWAKRAIVIELGVGGRKGARKTGAAIMRMAAADRVVGVIPVDYLKANAKAARDEFGDMGYPKEMVKPVFGALEDDGTWEKIAKQIQAIVEIEREEVGTIPIFVIIQSPTYNDFTDEQKRKLHENVFKLKSYQIIFCPAVDCTVDIPLLNEEYNNVDTRQFALTAVAHHCWNAPGPMGHRMDICEGPSTVEIERDEEGYVNIVHIVRDYEIAPIRKIPEELLLQRFADLKTTLVHRMEAMGDKPPGLNYAACLSRSTLPSQYRPPRPRNMLL